MTKRQQVLEQLQSVIRNLETIAENTDARTINDTGAIFEALMGIYRHGDLSRMVDDLKEIELYLMENKNDTGCNQCQRNNLY